MAYINYFVIFLKNIFTYNDHWTIIQRQRRFKYKAHATFEWLVEFSDAAKNDIYSWNSVYISSEIYLRVQGIDKFAEV